jgi:hypothetical protein
MTCSEYNDKLLAQDAHTQVTCIGFENPPPRNGDESRYEHYSGNYTTIVLGPADQQGIKVTPWTAMEQQLLEQALKTYPASTPERWDRIAECLPTRSKKDCMRRYKVHITISTIVQELIVQNLCIHLPSLHECKPHEKVCKLIFPQVLVRLKNCIHLKSFVAVIS